MLEKWNNKTVILDEETGEEKIKRVMTSCHEHERNMKEYDERMLGRMMK